MKFEYDKEVDAGYIYLDDSVDGVDKTIELNDDIIVDFDKNGKLLGIEILNASKVLSRKSLVNSQIV